MRWDGLILAKFGLNQISAVIDMAKPNSKLPSRTVDVSCAKCHTALFKYAKGGKGALVKCFKQRIVSDFTHDSGICPKCATPFARETLIRGAPAYKIIGGKVMSK